MTWSDKSGLLDMQWWQKEGPKNWNEVLAIDQPDTVQQLRQCTYSGRPFGTETFVLEIGRRIGRTWVRGRPKKKAASAPGTEVSDQFGFPIDHMRPLNIAILSTVPVVLIAAVILAVWSYDVWNDRSHSVSVLADTPIYAGNGSEACGGNKLTLAHRGLTFRVRRIRYWKNCATLDVEWSDGRTGYIVLGDGDLSVTPPLNR